MKSKAKSSRVTDRYAMIEPLEPRIAPAAVVAYTNTIPANAKFVTYTSGGGNAAAGGLLLKAGEVLTTGANGGGAYLIYVEAGQVLVHTTDLNNNGQFDYNEITGLSVGNGARFTSFVDIHGDIVTDLNPDGTLSDNGKGDVLLDSNIAEIDLRSLTPADFPTLTGSAATAAVTAHLALSSYSIDGNIYAGGGLGLATDPLSGLHINTTGGSLQSADPNLNGTNGSDFYTATQPNIGSIYAGTAASGMLYTFGSSGALSDIHGNLLAFNPSPGEAGASIYNIGAAASGQAFNIGTIEAGNGGFNAPGGSVVNVAMQGAVSGTYKLIAGNGGNGPVGGAGGSVINFTEQGAFLSEVVLQSGNGGIGLTGAGGNAGQIAITGTAKVNAHVVLNEGSGGNGYTQGGAGGRVPAATFTTVEGKITQPIDLVTSWHPNGTIGDGGYLNAAGQFITGQSIDFNGDGFSDAVFATINPDQVVVGLGGYNHASNLFGLEYNQYIYLNVPAQVQAITVGDFTGAINPVTHQPELDIAVASANQSFAGIYVFLSEYNPKTGAFEGFSDALYSPLPSLVNFGVPYFGSVGITHIVSGDFFGTGVTGLAVVEDLSHDGSASAALMFLNGETDAAHPGGTGWFYANTGNLTIYGAGGTTTTVANTPFIFLGTGATGLIVKATALEQYTPTTPVTPGQIPNPSNGYDVVVMSGLGSNDYDVYADAPAAYKAFTPAVMEPIDFAPGSFGQVLVPGATAPVDFDVQDFTIAQDANHPDRAELVAVSQSPVGFIATFPGMAGGAGFRGQASTGLGTGNAYFDPDGYTPQAIVTIPNGSTVPSGTLAGTPLYSNVAVLDYNTAPAVEIDTFQITTVANPPMNAPFSTTVTNLATNSTITPLNAINKTYVAFGSYDPDPTYNQYIDGSGPGNYGFITGDPVTTFGDGTAYGDQALAISQPSPFPATGSSLYLFDLNGDTAPLKLSGYYLNGGDGGNSTSGAGGAGGSFGQSLTVTGSGATATGAGTLSFEFPVDPTYLGVVRIEGGNGGNGFDNGGAGGTLNGISVTYAGPVIDGTAVLFAGNGGQSLTETGGAGGSLSQLFINGGQLFVGGNGGSGIYGGAGGSLIGNGSGLVSTVGNDVAGVLALGAGAGGTGILGGGNGGNVNGFVAIFTPLTGGTDSAAYLGIPVFLNYVGGAGGNAVAGKAGNGGSVINSSPLASVNFFAGDIYLQGGAGGNGITGGSGGSVTNFAFSATIKDTPSSATIIGGTGGSGTLGTGGSGGGISSISVTSSAAFGLDNNPLVIGNGSGTLYTFDFSDIANINFGQDAIVNMTAISYNKAVAGAAGASSGGAGGTGGSVSSITMVSTASNSQTVVAAGAGGSGLTAGGAGGSVISAALDAGSAAGSGKILVIAGDGGTSSSVKPASLSAAAIAGAIGGVDGPGGAGGSIIGMSEDVNTATHVDLIAGNGGATINHSVGAGNATVDNSGKGGSIENINVLGSIGNSSTTAAIISYNNIFSGYTAGFQLEGVQYGPVYTGTTMQDFVTNYILANPSLPITDGLGNVGIVAGAAGQVEGGLASFNGVSGSVANISAENIMSMVAGNVNEVSFIQSLTNYGVTINGGVLGAQKLVYYDAADGILYTSTQAEATALNASSAYEDTAQVNLDFAAIIAAEQANPNLPDENYINNQDGFANTPIPGAGSLIDGAFWAVNIRKPVSIRDFVGTE